jgi:hypothetical protein
MTDDERRAAAWNDWATAIVARELEAERRLLLDGIGMTLAEERKNTRAEIQAAVGELRAELAVQHAAEKANVIDLPALPLRRRSHAA